MINDAFSAFGAGISGAEIIRLRSTCVYGWFRGEECLYIGASGNFLARIATHNYIGVVEPIQPGDEFRLILDETPFLTEGELIKKYKPKYNQLSDLDSTGLATCILCGRKYKQKRKWQRKCGKC